MRYFITTIVFTALFNTSVFANLPKIDECKTDLYYANGILINVSERDARETWEEKATDLLLSNQEALNKISKFGISYNTSYGTTSDLFEAFLQKVEGEAGLKVTWEAFKLFVGLKLKYADDLLNLAANVNNSIENYDLITQVNAYKNSIKSGHGVIVISHSQGNLFTNRAYAKLDEWMKPYFHNIGVATPADEVASNGPYVTFDNDPIHHIPGALGDNLYNQNRYYSHTNALGEKVEALTGAFHSFDYYLGLPVLVNDVSVSSNQAAEKIKSFIVEKIQAHTDAPSQWETDQEFDKNTKNYRISVKHRFDPSITTMDGKEVFPFAPSKKLYYVQGEFPEDVSSYVKARCGGYKIENTWSEQDTLTELKRLVHSINSLPNEILYYKCEYPNKLNYSTGQCEVEVAKFGWDATFGTKEVHERYGYNQINWNPGIHSQDYSSGKHTITFNIMGFVPKGAVITSATWHIRYHIYPRYSQDVASGNLAINENVVTGGGFATFSHYGLWKFAGIIRVSWYYP